MALNFFRELRRRRVLRTASIYVVGAWLLMQVADIVFPTLGLPESAMRNLLYGLTAGFPLALIAGWFFDITKQGIRVTRATDEELPPLIVEDYAMIAVVVFVGGLIAFTLWPEPDSDIGKPGSVAIMPFEDEGEQNAIGRSLAAEVIAALKRVPGVWVPGLDSSTHHREADAFTVGQALGVGAVLRGSVRRVADVIAIDVVLYGTKRGREVKSLGIEVPVAGLLAARQQIVNAVIGEILPLAAAVQQASITTEACAPVYDVYLRARQIAETPGYRAYEIREKAVVLLKRAVGQAPDCALAWSGLAHAHFTMAPQFSGAERFEQGLVPAGMAARRALELDESLADAWVILAEIAEQESRFIDAENYFLKALLAEPTNANANSMYAESLLARGRVSDGLHFAMEGYRQDPASRSAAFKAGLAAKMAGDGDRAVEYGNIMRDLSQQAAYDGFAEIARGHILNGDVDAALEEYNAYSDRVPAWFPDCVQARRDPALLPDVMAILRSEDLATTMDSPSGWWAIVCATWLEEADLVMGWLFDNEARREITEGYYFPFFFQEAASLRQHPRFRRLVEEEGLLEYWRNVGWPDYCEPDGDSFRCR